MVVDPLSTVRHSASHILAEAVLELFPQALLGMGPATDTGFYYDFELPRPIEPEADFPRLEQAMRRIIGRDAPFVRRVVSRAEAAQLFANQPYKLELLAGLADGAISVYEHDGFVDLCRGPHVASTGEIGPDALALDRAAGAYWRGDSKRPMLTRIYGLAFASRRELEAHVRAQREAEKRDHRKLGAELDLFHIEEEIGRGLPLWLPNGMAIREELEKLAKENEFLGGYVRVSTPEITREELFYRSGHLPYYKDGMFPPMVVEEHDDAGAVTSRETFYLKPMNCPMHHMVYRARPRSYRELPLRLAEFGHDYRYEKSGQLSGLLRVRGMTMNDAHIYTPKELAKEEFKRVMELHLKYFRLLHFDAWRMRLSLSDPDSSKYIPRPDLWREAEALCVEAMEELGLDYEPVRGEAAFYGPKVDAQVKNVVGREETASTNQVDPMASLEDRFDLTYAARDGSRQRPWVLHRAPLGTHERFIAFLIEHFAGAFPLWLAPVQVRVLPIGDTLDYAHALRDRLFSSFVRVELDDSSDTFNKKVRSGTVRKIPVLAIVGREEVARGTVTVRRYHDQQRKETLPLDTFVEAVLRDIRERVTPKPQRS
jgi:threonyl-tRNA synthetase